MKEMNSFQWIVSSKNDDIWTIKDNNNNNDDNNNDDELSRILSI